MMDINYDNSLIIKNMDGTEIKINILDAVENPETNKKFICYTIENLSGKFISSLEETEDSFSLGEVTEEEREAIENLIMNEGEEE